MQIQEWDERYESFYGELNPKEIYKYPYAGMFRNPLQLSEEETVDSYVYIPENAIHSRQGVMIAAEGDVIAAAEADGWLETADRNGVILLLVSHLEDEDRLYTVYKDLRNRKHYNVNKAFRYITAYGKAATAAMKMTMKHPQEICGIVAVGNTEIDEAYMKEIGSRTSDLCSIPLCEVPVPVWLAGKENAGVADYWKKANEVEAEPYHRRGVQEYHPIINTYRSEIEHQTGAQLWISGETDEKGRRYSSKNYYEDFLSKTQRATSIVNGDLNPVRSMDEWHMERHTIEVDGYVREWYEYIPEERLRHGGNKLPLVVFFHGGSNTAWANICTTEWVKAASERGFALAFPSGTMRNREKAAAIPHPAWNAGLASSAMDDMRFTRKMIEDIENRIPIDKSRIYTSGHSMGACMSQETALVMPDIFAACAVTGGVIKGKEKDNGFFGSYSFPEIKTEYTVPVWIMLGEHDVGGGTFEENPRSLVNVTYWAKRNKTQAPDKPYCYQNGRYMHRIYENEAGIPLIDFTTVLDKPHCFTPQDAWFFYDEWFSKFQRDENGVLYYMGRQADGRKG